MIPTEPRLIQHQRTLLRAIRQAHQLHSTAETTVRDWHKGCSTARREAQKALSKVGIANLPYDAASEKPKGNVPASSALKTAAEQAKTLEKEISALVEDLLLERIASAHRRTRTRFMLATIIVIAGFVGWNAWVQRQEERAFRSAQATAIMQSAETQAIATTQAIVAQKTATAQAAAVQTTATAQVVDAQATATIRAVQLQPTVTAQAIRAQATVTAQAILRAEKWQPWIIILGADPVATAVAAGQTVYDLWLNSTDFAVYVYVPEGEFTMGANNGLDDEQPAHTVSLDAYWIMRTEVTNAQYLRCVTGGSCSSPNNKRWQEAVYADHPVTNVDWGQASAYCKWAGAALPTEAQWEKAARGSTTGTTIARIYPWGSRTPTADLANFERKVGDTTPVGNYPTGASPYGALDMAGNVWEWVNDWYESDYYAHSPKYNPTGPSNGISRVLRGGSWSATGDYLRASVRNYFDLDKLDYVGFRCAR
jgi:formylglycine-generating enzyme required for sulfatase activity